MTLGPFLFHILLFMIYIVMGVSGSGKTLIGKKLAEELHLQFYDADDFHSPGNVKKMKRGQPLNDADRLPWLNKLAAKMPEWEAAGGAVLACSALKKSYRNRLNPEGIKVQVIYLKGSKNVIAKRMSGRSDHFMPESLLQSQFDTLEEPRDALTVDISKSPEQIVDSITRQVDT